MSPRICVVAGGAGSLGSVTSALLIENGWKVVTIDTSVQQRVAENNFVHANLADPDATRLAFEHIEETHGPPLAVVNLAGRIANDAFFSLDRIRDGLESAILGLGEFERVFHDNFRPTFNVTAAAAASFLSRRGPGTIVNFSSVVAGGNAGQSAYAASKAAIESFSNSVSRELGRFGVRVVSIAPGFVDTATTRAALSSPQLNRVMDRTDLRRLTKPSEVAQLVLLVLENGGIAGTTLQINSGLQPF